MFDRKNGGVYYVCDGIPYRGIQSEVSVLPTKTSTEILIMWEIFLGDISGITTKAPCEVALIGERHVRIEICISLCALLS